MPGYKQRLFHSLRGPDRRLEKPSFYVIDAPVQYNVLLGREWIHRKMCVPSSLNQCIMLWHNNYVKVFPADPRPFEYEAKAAEVYADAYYYSKGDLQIRFFGLIDRSPLLKPRRRHQSIGPRRHKQVSDARLVWRWSAERPVK